MFVQHLNIKKNMEIISLLKEHKKAVFIANSIILELDKKVKNITEHLIFEKYKSTKIFKNNLEFELIGVRAYFNNFNCHDLSISKLEVSLSYICISKLPKNKREKVAKVKEEYKKTKRLEFSNSVIPLWFQNQYYLDLERSLQGEFNLQID